MKEPCEEPNLFLLVIEVSLSTGGRPSEGDSFGGNGVRFYLSSAAVLGRVPSMPCTVQERKGERAYEGEDSNEGVIIYYVGHSSSL